MKEDDFLGLTLTEKILKAHLVDGEFVKGSEIGLRIDQTLTQDATGTMAYLEFEAMGIPRVQTEKSVAYIDHNTLQSGFENADDHRFIGSVAKKHGIYFSRPGNGICHQVHLERFGVPGKTLIGSDSHTPTGGGIGMIAIGAGGLDVAVAMGGGAYYITYPKIVKVELIGKLSPWVAAKDVILEVLRIMSVKGGVGKVIEYTFLSPKEQQLPIWEQNSAQQLLYSPPMKLQKNFLRLKSVKRSGQNLSLMMTLFMMRLLKLIFLNLLLWLLVLILPTTLKALMNLENLKLTRFVSALAQTHLYLI